MKLKHFNPLQIYSQIEKSTWTRWGSSSSPPSFTFITEGSSLAFCQLYPVQLQRYHSFCQEYLSRFLLETSKCFNFKKLRWFLFTSEIILINKCSKTTHQIVFGNWTIGRSKWKHVFEFANFHGHLWPHKHCQHVVATLLKVLPLALSSFYCWVISQEIEEASRWER